MDEHDRGLWPFGRLENIGLYLSTACWDSDVLRLFQVRAGAAYKVIVIRAAVRRAARRAESAVCNRGGDVWKISFKS